MNQPVKPQPKPQPRPHTPVVITDVRLSLFGMIELIATFWLASFVIWAALLLGVAALAGIGLLAFWMIF